MEIPSLRGRRHQLEASLGSEDPGMLHPKPKTDRDGEKPAIGYREHLVEAQGGVASQKILAERQVQKT